MSAFEPRWYRQAMRPAGLVAFRVVQGETDLMIYASQDLADDAARAVAELRRDLETYVAAHPHFRESFVPVPVDAGAPPIARSMADAAEAAGVGPMAAVAGAFADAVGERLRASSPEVIVENGGDLFVASAVDRVVAVWGGDDVADIGLRLAADSLPCGVATSSATVGPSVSMGRASAATVVARSSALADAVASGVGNRVHSPSDIDKALEWGRCVDGVSGVLVIVDGSIGVVGNIELVPLSASLE